MIKGNISVTIVKRVFLSALFFEQRVYAFSCFDCGLIAFYTEKLVGAVKCLIKNKTIFRTPKDAQDTAATLILLERNKGDYSNRVSLQKVEELKQEW